MRFRVFSAFRGLKSVDSSLLTFALFKFRTPHSRDSTFFAGNSICIAATARKLYKPVAIFAWLIGSID